ncbi:MAG: GNAT family N-acetyltransferase [Acholeplasmatales bacterium]|jgi:ribosomal protein S18 acetylase RimI-like enzyme|nr:GNAT family N-acetyltransferase [Acholeplasmatales bacterium]
MEVNIRRASLKDIPYLTKLLLEVHRVHSDVRPDLFKRGAKKYSEEELTSMITTEIDPIFVAVAFDRVIGYAFCIHKEVKKHNSLQDLRTLYIDDLCVDEEFRGEHIGKMLYEYVLAYAKEKNYYNVTLNVWADNINAVKFYERIGMRIQKIGMEAIL